MPINKIRLLNNNHIIYSEQLQTSIHQYQTMIICLRLKNYNLNQIKQQMGQSQHLFNPLQLSPELLTKSVNTIFDHKSQFFTKQQILEPLTAILQQLSQNHLMTIDQNKLTSINKTLLDIYYQEPKNFYTQMLKLTQFFVTHLEQIMKSKSLLFVSRQDWKVCSNVCNFLILLSNEKTLTVIEALGVRSDLSKQTKERVEKFIEQRQQFEISESIVNKLPLGEIQRLDKTLRISLNYMIQFRQNLFTRSDFTLHLINQLEYSCFMMYMKIFFSSIHHTASIKKAKQQHLKTNLLIASYFLAIGIDRKISAVFQSAVIFLSIILAKNENKSIKLKPLPSHLFKSLPIIASNNIYEFILCYLLFGLTFIKQKGKVFLRFVCNRMMSLKLATLIVKEYQIRNDQIQFYLETLCSQIKIGQIQRAFLCELTNQYLNVRQSQNSKASTKKSQLLNKFKETSKIVYNLSFSSKKYKVTSQQIITEMQNDQNTFQRQFKLYSEKFVQQVILKNIIICKFQDKQVWNQILPHILQDRGQKAESDSDDQDMKKQQKQQFDDQEN